MIHYLCLTSFQSCHDLHHSMIHADEQGNSVSYQSRGPGRHIYIIVLARSPLSLSLTKFWNRPLPLVVTCNHHRRKFGAIYVTIIPSSKKPSVLSEWILFGFVSWKMDLACLRSLLVPPLVFPCSNSSHVLEICFHVAFVNVSLAGILARIVSKYHGWMFIMIVKPPDPYSLSQTSPWIPFCSVECRFLECPFSPSFYKIYFLLYLSKSFKRISITNGTIGVLSSTALWITACKSKTSP